MRIGNIDINKLRGLADKGLGFGKELFGTVIGNERLQDAGEAQQAKAAEQLKALRHEVKAEGKTKEAKVAEQRQRAAERAKAS